MSPKNRGHTHQYRKHVYKKTGRVVWRCMLPDCTHFIGEEFIVGKTSLCPSCDEPFLINKHMARERVFPKCQNCAGNQHLNLPQHKSNQVSPNTSEQSTEVLTDSSNPIADIMKKYGL